jgi:hypothetical protein
MFLKGLAAFLCLFVMTTCQIKPYSRISFPFKLPRNVLYTPPKKSSLNSTTFSRKPLFPRTLNSYKSILSQRCPSPYSSNLKKILSRKVEKKSTPPPGASLSTNTSWVVSGNIKKTSNFKMYLNKGQQVLYEK